MRASRILKIARIPYLNAEPFFAGWGDDPPFDVIELVPRALGTAARDGVIDAGLMAVADWFTVSGDFALIEPALGVAAHQQVRSVVLFSDEPVRLLGGKRIGVTGESSTSRRLLELLARAKWGIEDVTWIPEEEIAGAPRGDVDALLLIGNRALEVMALPDRGGWVRAVDLAAEWWAWQELPFVFAAWVVRKAVPRRERERFAGFLSGSLALGSERLGEIAEARAGKLGDAEALRDYLENLVYRLGPSELEGLQRFRDLLAEHDILEYPTTSV